MTLERDRKLQVRQGQEEAERYRLEEKRKRRAQREAAKKAAELKKLKEEVYVKFVQKGEYKEHILGQEMIEINGNHQKVPCVGGLGGLLG